MSGNIANQKKGMSWRSVRGKKETLAEKELEKQNEETAMKPEGIVQLRKKINRVAASTGNENGKVKKESKTRDLINILIVRCHERNVATV